MHGEIPVTSPPTNPMSRRTPISERSGRYFFGVDDSCAIAGPVGVSCFMAGPVGVGDSCIIEDSPGDGVDPVVPEFGAAVQAAPVKARATSTPETPLLIRMCILSSTSKTHSTGR